MIMGNTPLEYPPRPPDDRGDAVNNGLAIAALIFGVFFWPLGIVFGLVSNHEAKAAHRKRSGLAIAGVVLGCVGMAVLLIILVVAASSHPDPTQQYINCVNNAVANGTPPGNC